MKTFDPSTDHISVDYPTDRILLNGLSFDHVVFKDGYMEPSISYNEAVHVESDVTMELASSKSEHQVLDDKDITSSSVIEVLPYENTDASSLCLNASVESTFDQLQIDSTQKNEEPTSPVRNAVRTTLNVERNLKKIVRSLRKSLKRQFDEVYNKKHYYWDDVCLRKQTLKFFTELSTYQVPSEFYMKNEEVFFKLIHNTYDESKYPSTNGKGMVHVPVTDLFKDVFGQHPNKKNLVKFFSCEAVKFLWEGAFQQSKEFKEWKRQFLSYSASERNKMFKYLLKINKSAGFTILSE